MVTYFRVVHALLMAFFRVIAESMIYRWSAQKKTEKLDEGLSYWPFYGMELLRWVITLCQWLELPTEFLVATAIKQFYVAMRTLNKAEPFFATINFCGVCGAFLQNRVEVNVGCWWKKWRLVCQFFIYFDWVPLYIRCKGTVYKLW